MIESECDSLIIAWALHKALDIPGNISTLIGVGSSICGGSAIAATAPVIDAGDDDVAQAISVIFFFNVIAAIIFPMLGNLLGRDNCSKSDNAACAGNLVTQYHPAGVFTFPGEDNIIMSTQKAAALIWMRQLPYVSMYVSKYVCMYVCNVFYWIVSFSVIFLSYSGSVWRL